MSESSQPGFRCSECDREIVNRAVERCLYCAAAIPQALRFSDEEIRQNEEAADEIVRKADQRRKRHRSSGGGMDGPLD